MVLGSRVYSVGMRDRADSAVGEREEVTDCTSACLMIPNLFLECGRRDARDAERYGESNNASSSLSGRRADEDELR